MVTRIVTRVMVLFFAGLLGMSSTTAQEQSIRRGDVPKAVLKAFLKSYPEAIVIGYSKEVVGDTVTYEIECTENDIHRDVTYTADGALVSTEESLPVTGLPEAIREALAEEYPEGKIERCERITKGSVIQFEVLISSGGGMDEVLLSPDGTILRKEKK